MTIPTSVFAARRAELSRRVGGATLLVGNGELVRNIPIEALPFRQDSTFLYFTGCTIPDAALLLVEGESTLFLPRPADDDALWHGRPSDLAAIGASLGIAVRPKDELAAVCAATRPLHTLAVSDPLSTAFAAESTGTARLAFGKEHGLPTLVDAVIAMRRTLDPHELDEMRATQRVTDAGHRAVMAATRPGRTERELDTLFRAVSGVAGLDQAYPPICTVRGEVLHNRATNTVIREGQLLLLDAGAESALGYATDVTRTWPVSGRFDPRQRAAYEVVLEAQRTAIERVRPGIRYRDLHLAASRVIARFLIDEGIVRASVDEAVERGAHALFFPHGLGHLVGLDVHDLENFGDCAAYGPGRNRSKQFGLCYLRLDLDLEAGMVVTIEPGFYVVPAILENGALMEPLRDIVDGDRAASWRGFGGIRIEDDVLVTEGAPEVLSSAVPKAPDEVERLVGTRVDLTIAA